MATASSRIGESPVPLQTDKTVRRLDEFPELLQALRDCDLLTARLFCAQVFSLDGPHSSPESKQANALRSSTPHEMFVGLKVCVRRRFMQFTVGASSA